MPDASSPVALVTGANRGIGLELCRQLASRGYTVLLTARDAEKANAAAESLRADGLDVRALQLDVTDADSIAAATAAIRDQFGRLDVLINNAGIDYDTDQDVLNADLDRMRAGLETHTLGPLRLVQALLPLLRKSARARVVNVSSGAGARERMDGTTPAYSLSKWALNALTMMLAAQLKDERILVNAVGPGWVRTDMGGPDATRHVSEGAASVLWAATLPDDGPTGGFFRDGQRIDW